MLSLPLFYQAVAAGPGQIISLDDATARHVVQVLRMSAGEQLRLTDGQGHALTARITDAGKRRCAVTVEAVSHHPRPAFDLRLGIAFTKNTSRNEWLLEKATELGVQTIYPLITQRSEHPRVKTERWQGILTAAMLQSQQYYLPRLAPLTKLEEVLSSNADLRLMAHCETEIKRILPNELPRTNSALILIGPEGDFSPDEISLAMQQGFQGLFLGHTRLRTETAALAACAFLQLHAL